MAAGPGNQVDSGGPARHSLSFATATSAPITSNEPPASCRRSTGFAPIPHGPLWPVAFARADVERARSEALHRTLPDFRRLLSGIGLPAFKQQVLRSPAHKDSVRRFGAPLPLWISMSAPHSDEREDNRTTSAQCTVKTGQVAVRTTFSATLPMSARATPPRPCVPITATDRKGGCDVLRA